MAKAKKSLRAIEPEDLRAHIDKALALQDAGASSNIYKGYKFFFDPQAIHVDRLDKKRPSLFVANHGPYGIEGALLPSLIHEYTGTLPRLTADYMLINSPFGDSLMKLGLVLGNRTVCAALMEAGESILVYPGGRREGAKARGDEYKLYWEGRTGFVRMAIEHGFTITPIACIGPDEVWDYTRDKTDLEHTWFAALLKWMAPDEYNPEFIAPIPSGILGTIIPRPERFYIAIGKPYDTKRFAGKENDQQTLNRIKNTVQKELEGLIAEALIVRSQRRHEIKGLRRLLTRH